MEIAEHYKRAAYYAKKVYKSALTKRDATFLQNVTILVQELQVIFLSFSTTEIKTSSYSFSILSDVEMIYLANKIVEGAELYPTKTKQEIFTILQMAEKIERSLILAQEKLQKRSEMRGMAMMFHPTNGRNLYDNYVAPVQLHDISLAWTSAIELLVVDKVKDLMEMNKTDFDTEIRTALMEVCGVEGELENKIPHIQKISKRCHYTERNVERKVSRVSLRQGCSECGAGACRI